MKRIIARMLLISILLASLPVVGFASEKILPVVNVTFLADGGLEQQYRLWAADVIWEYYYEYCDHDSPQNKTIKLKNTDTIEDKVWSWVKGAPYIDSANVAVSSLNMNGLYSDYYLASLIKMDYDFNEDKTKSYTVVRFDKDSDADYEKRMKPFYKKLLIDTFEEKYAISPTAMEKLNADYKHSGSYTLKEVNGELVMIFDEKGVMGNLEEMANAETAKVFMNLMEDSIKTAVDTAIAINVTNDYLSSISKAATAGVTSLMKQFTDTSMDRKLAQLKNGLITVEKSVIANKDLQNYNTILAYLENVYAKKDPDYTTLLDDPVFLKAVSELLETVKDKRKVSPKEFANSMAEYYVEGIELENIISWDDMMEIMELELLEQIVEIAIAPIKTWSAQMTKADGSGTLEFVMDAFTNVCIDFFKSIVKEIINNKQKEYKIGKQIDIDDGDLIKDITNSSFKDIVKEMKNAKTKVEKERKYSDSTINNNIAWDITISVMDTIIDIGDLVEQYNQKKITSGELKEKALSKTKDMIITMGTSVWNAQADMKKMSAGLGIMTNSNLNSAEKTKEIEKLVGRYEFVKTLISIKDDILQTADSLAKTADAGINDRKDEKQTSYRAVAMYSAYKASKPLEASLKANIQKKFKNDIRGVASDPNQITLAELRQITDRIMLQVEYDMIGTRWLIELLLVSEGGKKDITYETSKLLESYPSRYSKMLENEYDQFTSYIMLQARYNGMESYMTSDYVNRIYSKMGDWRQKWKSSWKQEYEKFSE